MYDFRVSFAGFIFAWIVVGCGRGGGLFCDSKDWCAGDQIRGCREPEDVDDHTWTVEEEQHIRDCSLTNQSCIETGSGASCVWKEMACERNAPYCKGNEIYNCAGGYISSITDCAEKKRFCVENPNAELDGKRALCAVEPGLCIPEEGEMCVDSHEFPGVQGIIYCNGFYWDRGRNCNENEVCISYLNEGVGTAQCALSATPCPNGVETFCFDDVTVADCSAEYPEFHRTCPEVCHQLDDAHAECGSWSDILGDSDTEPIVHTE